MTYEAFLTSKCERFFFMGHKFKYNKAMSDKLFIFDTTLRDGEQVPGCQLNTVEKIQVARQLEALG